MIRGWACVLLILVVSLAAIPGLPSSHGNPQPQAPQSNTFPKDPNATLSAFNYTYAQADLYTKSSPGLTLTPAVNSSGTQFVWLNTVPKTKDGTLIPGSAFRFNLTTPPPPQGRQEVNWTLTIPQFNCLGCNTTSITFAFLGSLTKGTSANYTVTFTNGTRVPGCIECSSTNTGPGTFPGPLSTGCRGSGTVCIGVTKFIGYDLRLSFRFGWNSSETGMRVEVGELVVTSIDQTFKNSKSNSMTFNATDTTKVSHTAKFSSITYNSTVSYRNPLTPGNITHTWSMEILDIYYPAGYDITQVSFNKTVIFPTPPTVLFDRVNCFDGPCSTSRFALNMSDFGPTPNPFSINSTIVMSATTPNSISLNTLSGVSQVDYFLPEEQLSLRVVNAPAVINGSISSRTGRLNITFVDPHGSNVTILPKSIATSSGGLLNYTIPSSSQNPFGLWNITVSFVNNFDLGLMFHTFRVEQIQLTSGSFTYSGGTGSGTALSVRGNLIYASSSSPAANVNATVFAIKTGPGASLVYTKGTPSSGLYMSNITLVNGIGTVGRPIIMYFSLINPTSNQLNASLTIDHEWYSGQTHGVNVTIPLRLGDDPFLNTPVAYRLQAAFTAAGIQLILQSLQTNNQVTVNMTPGVGASAVSGLRQHFGLFKFTIHSNSTQGAFSQSLESPPYAYLLYSPLGPSQLLAYSPTVTTLSSDGSFSTSLSSNQLLGAKNLFLIVLARDANGVVLGDSSHNPTVASDSTILTPTVDLPSDPTVSQSVTVTLHLKSNSTIIGMTLDINLDVTGASSLPTQTKTVTAAPGKTVDIPFTFTAPSQAGPYLATFSSPQYGPSGSPLLTKTMQVSLVASNLQILIPAAIGLVAAIVILGVYLVRRGPEEKVEPSEKTRPAGGKPTKPQSGQSTSKSLTRSETP